MKKLMLLMCLIPFAVSAEIPFGVAWGEVANTSDYWIGIFLSLCVVTGCLVWIKKRVGRYGLDGQVKSMIVFIVIVILFAILVPVKSAADNSNFDNEGKVILI